MALRVLVTRPLPAASRTADRLASMGFSPILLPLTTVEAIPLAGPIDVDGVALVAATSANALRHAPKALLEAISDIPCMAVGAETASVARRQGIARVAEGGGDAESLAGAIASAPPAGRVLYLCGKVRRPEFERILKEALVPVQSVETYGASVADHAPDALEDLLGGKEVDAVLLYSPKAAEAYAALAWPSRAARLLDGARYFCLSPRIAATLPAVMQGRALAAARPDEAALFELLGERAAGS